MTRTYDALRSQLETLIAEFEASAERNYVSASKWRHRGNREAARRYAAVASAKRDAAYRLRSTLTSY